MIACLFSSHAIEWKAWAEVDMTLTTLEVVKLIDEFQVNFRELPETDADGALNQFTRITESGMFYSEGSNDLSIAS